MEVYGRTVHVPSEGVQVDVYHLGDIHEGHINHNEAALARAVGIIRAAREANPFTYTHLMGDLIDCIVAATDYRWDPLELSGRYAISDLRDLAAAQTKRVLEKLEPIATTVSCMMEGNHEREYTRHHYADIYDRLWEGLCRMQTAAASERAVKLGYVGWYTYSYMAAGIPVGRFTFALNHGQGGGGKREGYPLNLIYDTFRWSEGDFRIMGHMHSLVADGKVMTGPNPYGSGKSVRTVWHGMSGCFLDTFQAGHPMYFEHKGRPPSDIGMLKASFKVVRSRHAGGMRQRLYVTKLEKIPLGEEGVTDGLGEYAELDRRPAGGEDRLGGRDDRPDDSGSGGPFLQA